MAIKFVGHFSKDEKSKLKVQTVTLHDINDCMEVARYIASR